MRRSEGSIGGVRHWETFTALLLQKLQSRRGFLLWLCVCAVGLLLSAGVANWRLIRNRNLNKHVVAELGHGGYAIYELAMSAAGAISERMLGFADASPYRDYLSSVREHNHGSFKILAERDSPRKHLIYIQMESVDGFSIRARHSGRAVMPFLRELRDRAIQFPHTADNTSAGRTTDGEFMALTGLPPLFGKPVFANYDLSRIPSLPRVLNAAGYYTFSIHGYRRHFWNRANAHRQLGFEESFFFRDLDSSDRIGWGISDHSVLQQAADRIATSERPVFAHIVLLTNHHPYQHVGAKFGYAKSSIVENHVDSLRYMDASIRAFFERLESEGLIERCLIAIYGDHDSSVAPRLLRAFELDQPALLPDSVPLMLIGSRSEPREVAKVAGLQDLPVIALAELGLPIPATFAGNAADSPLPNLTSRRTVLSLAEDGIVESPAPIDPRRLTKLAILHPDKLGGAQ